MKGRRTCSGPSVAARDQPSLWVTVTPNFSKVRSISGNCSGAVLRTAMAPPVIAPSARKVVISWKSSLKRNSPPPRLRPPTTLNRDVPMPSIGTPSMAMNRQNSWTCGSEAALTRVDVPSAPAAQSTKFSVVVTEA